MSNATPVSEETLKQMDAYWRAANYLSAGQLYLLQNPLLRSKLSMQDVKKKIVGHWGTVPGQNFIYTHLNRVIKQYDLDMIYLSGPGHGGNAMVAQDWLDGSYSEFYPNITRDAEGMQTMRTLATGCTCPPEFPVCVCGKTPRARLVSRKPVEPSAQEIVRNNRSRSAKLRVLEKIEAV